MHIPNPYTLPAFDFVGGSTQDLIFHCYFFKTKKPQDLSACVADFSIINFVNKMVSRSYQSKWRLDQIQIETVM